MAIPGARVLSLDNPRPPQAAPYVQPGAGAHATGYAAGVAARRSGTLPKYNGPVGGLPSPPMPALEQPHRDGMTMAAQAQMTRGPDASRNVQRAMAGHAQTGSIVIPEDAMPPPPQMPMAGPRLHPLDTLPDEAIQDPQFHRGTGSLMAQSQPHLAMKYGVIRDGQRLTPNDVMGGPTASPGGMRGNKARRSPDVIARELKQALMAPPGAPGETDAGPEPPPGIPRSVAEAEAQAAQGPGGAASRAGASPVVPGLDASTPESEAKAKRLLNEMDDFDFERLRREMLSDILKNPKQREDVEKRLEALDIGELITRNVIQQRVPILPGKFMPTFESMQGGIELRLKQLLVRESSSVAVTEAYLLDKYAVMTTTAGTVAINGVPLPPMYDERGDFSEDLFWAKFEWMLKRNIHMLASLGVHYSWFEQRVRKLFVASEGKDG